MLPRVKMKNGAIGYIEKYIGNGMCIVRLADGWCWCKEETLEYLT